jgi:Holliday junction resolvase RusA-like endonuclease
MEYEFTLPIKAFSVNAYHYRDKRHKTQEARAWEEEVKFLLDEHKPLLDIAAEHIKLGGEFVVYLTFSYPKHIFYNKIGQVSAKTYDLSNVEKPILDLIFKETMGVDDRFVTQIVSAKRPGASFAIDVKIRLIKN